FAPDKNLGKYISQKTGRELLLWDGSCVVHEAFSLDKLVELYKQNPEQYNLGSLNTWKIVNIVSLAISAVFVIWLVYLLATGKYDEMQQQYLQMLEELQKGQ
ncbi:MAG: quinolinate synthase NadA, partial [Flavobacterium sp.]|nr:quinolinate synthase NadA [Flavobacterium sp.]